MPVSFNNRISEKPISFNKKASDYPVSIIKNFIQRPIYYLSIKLYKNKKIHDNIAKPNFKIREFK